MFGTELSFTNYHSWQTVESQTCLVYIPIFTAACIWFPGDRCGESETTLTGSKAEPIAMTLCLLREWIHRFTGDRIPLPNAALPFIPFAAIKDAQFLL